MNTMLNDLIIAGKESLVYKIIINVFIYGLQNCNYYSMQVKNIQIIQHPESRTIHCGVKFQQNDQV